MNIPNTETRGLLVAPVGFWELTPDQLDDISNGGGPKVVLFGFDIGAALVPDSMYGLKLTRCFDVHDYDYYIKTRKRVADKRMYSNLRAKINSHGGFFRRLRLCRAWLYYQGVSKSVGFY
jgi:hypothetical protein